MHHLTLTLADGSGTNATVGGVWFDPDGRHLLLDTVSQSHLYYDPHPQPRSLDRWDLAGERLGPPLVLFDWPQVADVGGLPTFGPGNRLVWFAGVVRRLSDGSLVADLDPPPDDTLRPTYGAAFTPDESAVVVAAETLRRYDLAGHVEVEVGPRLDAAVFQLAIAPDGDVLAAVKPYDGSLLRWRLPGFEPLPPGDWGVGFGGTSRVVFGPVGDTLAAAFGHRVHLVERFDADPAVAVRCGPIRDLAFTPDGGRLLTVPMDGGGVDVWDTATGGRSGRLHFAPHLADVRCVAVSPDGLTAVAGGADGRLVRWDL